jgi:D-alanine transaminase
MAQALPIAYLNGEFLPVHEARISPLDRGFLFGDAIYEVVPFFDRRPLLLDQHLARLSRSLAAVGIPDPLSNADWQQLIETLAKRNDADNLVVYLQVSRGADSGRTHAPPAGLAATVFGIASEIPAFPGSRGVRAITLPDNRWQRCDIKATALLANILLLGEAQQQQAEEALLLRDGELTEGTTTSVLIVVDGQLLRRPNGREILPGTTTDLVVQLATDIGLSYREQAISEALLRNAEEIWITSAGRGVQPVVQLDGATIGDGEAGPLYNRVAARFKAYLDAR